MSIDRVLNEAVDKFCKQIGYQRNKINIQGPYDCHKANPNVYYPNAGEPGCYVFGDDQTGEILYVGKGCKLEPNARRTMGNRMWEATRPKPGNPLLQPGVGLWGIAFPQDDWFMAPALECFLIQDLNPLLNVNSC